MTAELSRVQLAEPIDVLYRIKRGMAAYISYLAACEMNESFSEYVLYEPILRILTARGYVVQCEVDCPGIKHQKVGDRKRLDFVATKGRTEFALEVKWAGKQSLDVERDVLKLMAYRKDSKRAARAFLCVFGRQSIVADVRLRTGESEGHLAQQGKIVTADLGKTKYSCRIFEETAPNKSLQPTPRSARGG
jgi:Holliday junction resolvase